MGCALAKTSPGSPVSSSTTDTSRGKGMGMGLGAGESRALPWLGEESQSQGYPPTVCSSQVSAEAP